MAKVVERKDDFQSRRKHLENLSDAELKARFWELIGDIVDPLMGIAEKQTSASVERSVLLRMGFSSLEAKAIVDGVVDRGLLAKGAGHVVYKASKLKDISVRQAGVDLIEGLHWDDVLESFGR